VLLASNFVSIFQTQWRWSGKHAEFCCISNLPFILEIELAFENVWLNFIHLQDSPQINPNIPPSDPSTCISEHVKRGIYTQFALLKGECGYVTIFKMSLKLL